MTKHSESLEALCKSNDHGVVGLLPNVVFCFFLLLVIFRFFW